MYMVLTWKWNHQVISPNVFNMELWVQSGHAANYREDMFILEVCFFPIFINACLCKNVGWRPYLFILLESKWIIFVLMYLIAHVIITFMNDLHGCGTILWGCWKLIGLLGFLCMSTIYFRFTKPGKYILLWKVQNLPVDIFSLKSIKLSDQSIFS